jgi:ADP-heptose:LPS heptosyltransferase
MKKRLLLNFVYYNPVGHVMEAIKYAKGFHDANKDLEVHLALNSSAPIELAKVCPWIKKVYAIGTSREDTKEMQTKRENTSFFKKIPREWDYIITENRVILETAGRSKIYWLEEAFLEYLKLSKKFFHAKKGEGTLFYTRKLPSGLKYKSGVKVMLNIPRTALNFAKKYNSPGRKICILLGGSAGYCMYPHINSWVKIIKSLNNAFPDVKIYLTGVRKSLKGRTNTQAYTNKQIQSILKQFNNVVDCYDIGLWNQLALVQQCDIFISPHTGFGWLVSHVGTPWLALSGGDWEEVTAVFNGLPFYCVLPEDKHYPYWGQKSFNKYSSKGKIKGMIPKDLDKKIPEIIEGAELLFSKKFTYANAIKKHVQNIKRADIRQDYKKKMLTDVQSFKPSW